jgi:hypothetical protein
MAFIFAFVICAVGAQASTRLLSFYPTGIISILSSAGVHANQFSLIYEPAENFGADDALQIECPEDISTYTDINECTADISNNLNITVTGGALASLTWDMTGANEDASRRTGINQIESYVFNEGTTVVTYTARDKSGNIMSCSFLVTISDNQVPKLVYAPENITVTADENECGATVSWTEPVVTDNCTPTNQILRTSSHVPGSFFPVGSTKVTYILDDGMATTQVSYSFTVTVTDRVAPVLTAPANITVNCGEPLPRIYSSFTEFTAAGGSVTDNCNLRTSSFTYISQTQNRQTCPYAVTRTYQISDVYNNVGRVEHLIFVGEGAEPEPTVEPEKAVTLKSGMANFTAALSGNWSDPATWGGGVIPTSLDNVIIPNGVTVTIDAAAVCNNITIETGGTLISGNYTLDVNGNWTNDGTFAAGTGTVKFSGITNNNIIGGSSPTAFHHIVINKGTSNATIIEVNGTGPLSNTGNITLTNGLLKLTNGTFQFTSNPNIPTSAGIWVSGATVNSISGLPGFSINSNGLIRISDGVFNMGTVSGNSAVTNSNGTFELSGGTVNVAGRFKISGGNSSITGGTLNIATVGHADSNEGAFHVTVTANLSISGNPLITFTHPNSNAVPFNDIEILSGSGTKTITGGTFQMGTALTTVPVTFKVNSDIPLYNFSVFNGNSSVLLTDNLTVNHQLTLNGKLLLSDKNLILGNTAPAITGTFGAGDGMIITGTGEIQKLIGSNVSYSFPVGDVTGTADYTPVTLSFTSGTYASGAYATVKVFNLKHPNNNNTTNYLNRYWTITTPGITNPVYNINATYSNTDVTGNVTGFIIGSYASNWAKIASATFGANNLTINGVTQDLTFTALSEPTISITYVGPVVICSGSQISLTSSSTADLPASYSWSSVPVAFTGSAANLTTDAPIVAVQTSYIVTVTVIDGNGFTATDNIEITVNPLPTVNDPADQPVCNGTSTTAVSFTGTGTSYTWTNDNTAIGLAASGIGNIPAFTATNGTASQITANITVTPVYSFGGVDCSGAPQTLTITVNPSLPVSVTITSDDADNTICAGTSVTFTATPTNGGLIPVYQWKVNGINAGTNSSSFTTSTLQNGSVVTVTLTSNITPCPTGNPATSNTISMIVNPNPTVNVGGAIAAICQGGTTTGLGGSVGGGATGGTWSTPAGGTFNPDATTLNATWTPPAGYSGTATLTLTTSGGACGTVNASKNVIVNPNPIADAGAAIADICQGGTTTGLGGSVGGGATGGTWSSSAGGTFSPNATTLNATWTPPAAYSGTATLTLTTSGGLCGTTTASKQVLVNPGPTVSAGSPTAAICQGGTTAGLGGSVGGGATLGTWSTPAGGTFNPNETTLNATWTPPSGYSGTATLTLTTSGGACGTVNASKNVIVNPNPIADAGAAIADICQGGTTTGLGGSVGGGATGGTWSSSAGGTFSPNATTLNATWTPPAAYSGTATLTLTTSGGLCGTTTASKQVLVNPGPTVSAGSPTAAICQGGTTAGLGGSVGGGATEGTWSTPAGGTFNPDATTLNATWTPPAGYSGTATITLTTTGGLCGTTSASKTVSVNPAPTADAGGVITAICQGGTTAGLGGSVGGGASGGTWSTPAGGTFTPNANTLNATWTPPAGYSGTATLTLTTSGGSCGTATASKTVVVNPNPTVNAGVAIAAICQGGTTAALGGSYGGGATSAVWSDGGAGGTFANNSGSTPNTATYTASATAPATVTLTLTTSGGSCGIVSANKTLTVNPVLVPSVTITSTSTSICSSAGDPVTFTATPTNGGTTPTYQWKNGAANVGTNSSTYTVSSLAAGSVISVVMTSNATCASPATATSNNIAMTVYTAAPGTPGAITTNAPNSICPVASGYTFSVTPVANATSYVWNLPDAGWIITAGNGTNSITVTVSGAAVDGNNRNVSVQAQNPCGLSPASSALSFRVNRFAAVNAGLDQSVCAGGSINLSGTLLGAASSATWTASSGSFAPNATNLNANYTPTITSGTITLTLTPVPPGGTCSGGVTNDQMIVTVNPRPTAVLSGTQAICNGSAATLSLAVTGTGTISGTLSNGTAFSGTAPNISVNVSPTSTTTYTIATLSNGTCTSIAADRTGSATVTVNPRPTAALSGTTAICNGSTATLSLVVTGPGTISGTLSDGTAFSGTAPGFTVSVSPNATTTYTIATLTNGTCDAIAADITGTATVSVNNRPTAALSGTPTICNGGAATLSLAVTGTGTISGTLSDGTPFSGTAPTITVNVSPSATTNYTISTLTNGTCAAIAADMTGTAAVTVNPRPTAGLSGTPTICNGETATLSLAVTGTGTISGTLSDGTVFSGNAPTITVNVNPTTTTNYTVSTLTDDVCTAIAADKTGTATVTVNQRPTAALSGTQGICDGSTANLSLAVTGSGIISGTLSDGTPFSGNAPTITVNVSPSATTNYTISSLADANCTAIASDLSGSATVSVDPRPTADISGTPEICNGGTATLSLAVTGTGTISGTLSDGTAFSGTAPTISVNVSPAVTTSYTISTLTNGTCPVIPADMTGTATVTVNPRPTVVLSGTQAICNGGTVALSLAVSGSVTISGTLSDGTAFSGTAPTISVNVNPNTTTTYTVSTLTDANCAAIASDMTGSAIITVNEPIVITTPPAVTQTVCTSFPVSFSVVATGTGLTYQWRKGSTNIPGATSSTYTINSVSLTDAASDYYVVISGASPCTSVTSTNAELIVNQGMDITTQPINQTICEGENTTYTVAATGSISGYLWRKNGIPVSGGNITGENSATLTITGVLIANAGSYDVVISSTGGTCDQVISNSANLTVNTNATISLSSAPGTDGQTKCINTAITAITYTIGGTGTGASITAGALPTGLTGTYNAGVFTINGTPTVAGTFNYTVTTSGSLCINPSLSGTITVEDNGTISLTGGIASPTLCINTPLTTNIEYTIGGTATGVSITAGALPSGMSGSFSGGKFTISGTPTVSGTFNYTVTASGSACVNPSLSGTITVTPTVTIAAFSPASSTRCQGAGTVTTTTTATNSTGITYSLDAASITGGNTIDAAAGAVTYAAGWSGTTTITASAAGCNGPATTTHVVTVTPTVTIAAFSPATSTRCQGATTVTTTTTATNSTGITYSLDAASITGGNSIVAATGAVTYAAGWSGTTTITASAAGCNGPATTTHVVTITPTVTIAAFSPATSTRCLGAGTVTYSTTATNSTGITYSLDAASITGGNSIVAATGAVTYAAGWSGTTTITASAAGCNGPATTTHVVTVTPTVTIAAFSPATSIRCQGAGTVTYSTTATNSTGITYSLDAASITGGNSIVAATGAVTYAATWSGTSTITASAAGCNGPVTVTHTVTITPTVGIPVFTLGATSTRCQGAGTVTYGATATNSTGITYSLNAASLTGGNTINAATGAVTYVATWSGTSIITASAAGCNGPRTATHTVTITPTVGTPVFTLGATSTRCMLAGTVTYTATATNSTGINYTLDAASLAAGNTINTGTGAVTYAATWNGTSIITASAAGCNGPRTATHTVVTIIDTQPPVITTCLPNYTANAVSGTCAYTLPNNLNILKANGIVSSDNCAVVSLTNNFNGGSEIVGSTFPAGTTTVVWTARDAAGNTATCSHTVTIIDINKPVITNCPANIVVQSNVDCSALVSIPPLTYTDNCPNPTLTWTMSAPNLGSGTGQIGNFTFNGGTTTVTYHVFDAQDSVATCSFNVIVNDNVPPVAVCKDITIQLDNLGHTFITEDAVNNGSTDDCGGLLTFDTNKTVFDCTNVGVNNVILTVKDGGGNLATCNAVVTVQDVTPPNAACKPITVQLDAYGNVNIAPDAINNGSTDLCSAVIFASDKTSFDCTNIGNNTVTLTVTDASGNSATCFNIVTVEDKIPPVITCPTPLASYNSDPGQCYAALTFAATAIDNCGTATTITYSTSLGVAVTFPYNFPVGTTAITARATDAAGNVATCTFSVKVVDVEKPTIICPPTVTDYVNSGTCVATGVGLGTIVTGDNCGIASFTNNAPASFPLGSTFVTHTAVDNAGNTATCVQEVIILDNQIPSITCPVNVTVNANAGSCVATGVALGTPTATDNCGTTGLEITNDAPASFPIGTTVVTWTATDSNGNSANCQQTVKVTDNQNPTITCSANITVYANTASCTATGVVLIAPATADNCGVATVTNNAPVAYPFGNTTVTWTVTDNAGNTATCNQIVTVEDNTPPVPDLATLPVVEGDICKGTITVNPPTATDNCGIITGTTSDPISFTAIGIYTINWTYTDASGNTSTQTQTVNITSSGPPAPVVQNLPTLRGQCEVTVSTVPQALSGCSAVLPPISGTTSDPLYYNIQGTYTITWTYNDGTLTTTQTQSVIVDDTQPPVITCPADVTQNVDASQCQATVTSLVASCLDNCGGVCNITNDKYPAGGADASGIYPVGTTVVTFTATDAEGNISTCKVNVTITDIELPTITCSGDINDFSNNNCVKSINTTAPGYGDNCVGSTLTWTLSGATTGSGIGAIGNRQFNNGVTLVTYTIADAQGNTASCSFYVTLTDNTSPTIANCPVFIEVSTGAGNTTCTQTATWTPPTAKDNCTPDASLVWIVSHAPGSSFPVGNTTVTYTVTDASGNSATCSFNVKVIDNTPPLPKTLPNVVAQCAVTITPPKTWDNCATDSIIGNTTTIFPYSTKGVTTIVWTFIDASGNITSANQIVTINDTQSPTWVTLPQQNIPIECGDNVKMDNAGVPIPAINGIPTATDNCALKTVTYADVRVYLANCPVNYSIQRTWTAEDVSGNKATWLQTFTIQDNISPVLLCADQFNVDATKVPAYDKYVGLTATDNCTPPGSFIYELLEEQYFGLDQVAGFCPDSLKRTYIVRDLCGNVSEECVQTWHFIDNPDCEACIDDPSTTEDNVPFFGVIFDDPDDSWLSPNVVRNGICCFAEGPPPPRCISFNVYLHKDAVGLIFTIPTGAVPGGALYYHIDCGPAKKVGEVVCLAGGRFYTLTFCEPGNNPNTYAIQSISGAVTTEDITTRADENCIKQIDVTGLVPGTISWTVKYPAGADTLTKYLSCTTCANPVFTPDSLTPPTIIYTVCGQLIGTYVCDGVPLIDCADVTVTTYEAIRVSVDKDLTALCNGAIPYINAEITPTNLTYSYAWYDGPDGTGNLLSTSPGYQPTNIGTYSVVVTDMLSGVGCPSDLYNFNIMWDTIGPILLVPPVPLQLECNDANAETIIANWLATAYAYDENVSSIEVFSNYSIFTHECGLDMMIRFWADDACGNRTIDSALISIIDTQAPVIAPFASPGTSNCSTVDPFSDPGFQLWLSNNGGAGATDACDKTLPLTWTNNSTLQTWSTDPANQQITVTFTVTDACGNTATTTATYSITDTEAPTISCPAPVSETAAANNCSKALVTVTDPNIFDNCTDSTLLILTYELSGATIGSGSGTVTGVTFNVGITNVQYVVADLAGFSDTCNFTVTIIDVTPPNAIITGCQDVTGTINANDCYALPPFINDPLYSDACWPNDSLILTFLVIGAWDTTGVGYVSGFEFPVGISTVTYRVTDPDNNYVECSFTVTMLRDAIPSTAIICPTSPAPITLGPTDCDVTLTLPPPTINDFCVTATYTITNNINGGSTIVNHTFDVGTTRVVWYIEDNSGNRDSCIVMVEVNGVQYPDITCPANVSGTMSADGCYAIPPTIGTPTYSAPCWPMDSLELTFHIINGAWDTTGVGLVNSIQFPAGVNTVWYIVTDPDDNKDSCSFTVSILRDAIPSTAIICPTSPAPITLGPTDCDVTLTLPPPTINDFCVTATYTITNNINGGSTIVNHTFDVGTTRVVWYIEDNSGNRDSCIVMVEVNGVQYPDITCPANVSGTMSADGCYAIPPTIGTPTYSAPCWPMDSLELTFHIINGAWDTLGVGEVNGILFPAGVNTVWYIVTDPDGNKDSCNFTVSILRDAIPSTAISCPVSPAPVTVAPGDCDILVHLDPPTISEYCETATYTIWNDYSVSLDTLFPVGTTIVTWFIEDNSGNDTTCIVTVVVNDLMPYITCPPDTVVQADFELPYKDGITLDLPVWGDNCPDSVLTWVLVPPIGYDTAYNVSELSGIGNYPNPDTFYLGVTRITYTVTDANNNTATCSFTVTVLGAPVIDCQPDTTVYADAACINTFDPGTPELLEGVPPIEWTYTIYNPDGSVGQTDTYIKNAPGDADPIGNYPFELGTSKIHWRAENISGWDTCSHYVEVIDTIPPTFNAGPFPFCVERLMSAVYNPATNDIDYNPDYPLPADEDYYLFRGSENSTVLDIDPDTFSDNCCKDPFVPTALNMRWTITLDDGSVFSGTNQPSTSGTDIQLWGDGVDFLNRTHTITFWVTDCNLVESAPVTRNIVITPRPKIVKVP